MLRRIHLEELKRLNAGCQITRRLPSAVYLLFGHDYVDIFHFIYHLTLLSRIYKKFSQAQSVDNVYWLCLNLLYIVDYFKSSTRVNYRKKKLLSRS